MQSCLHRFDASVQGIELPRHFTYPFHYTPHPLCENAAARVQAYLRGRADWAEELDAGKMFGVLVVQDEEGGLGFLAAFSGILAGRNVHDYFVPPVYDLLQPDGFFREEEGKISAINHQIETLSSSDAYIQARKELEEAEAQSRMALEDARAAMAQAKAVRDSRRQSGTLSLQEAEMLSRESQHQRAEYRRLEQRWAGVIARCRQALEAFDSQLAAWKQERHRRSAALQKTLFRHFRMLNARGEEKDLCQIFSEAGRSVPPAGAGECAAPKLLQYAYEHALRPLCMAEFWWGHSPKNELRRHGYYYPACRSKCEPILKHMLQGLDVEANPLLDAARRRMEPEVVWEDDYLVLVDKPAGMLSVPGKEDGFSVWEWMRRRCPQADGPLVVHRLDMATSGLLLLAKNKQVHAAMQALFETRAVRKCYVALLDGRPPADKGFVRLPLCPDPDERPLQQVNQAYGKPSVTRYEVLGREGEYTRVALYPLTGRTHQLRVHAAHPLGLDAPIVGDTLYGRPSDRLYLHAERLEFRHPVTGQWIKVEQKAMF